MLTFLPLRSTKPPLSSNTIIKSSSILNISDLTSACLLHQLNANWPIWCILRVEIWKEKRQPVFFPLKWLLLEKVKNDCGQSSFRLWAPTDATKWAIIYGWTCFQDLSRIIFDLQSMYNDLWNNFMETCHCPIPLTCFDTNVPWTLAINKTGKGLMCWVKELKWIPFVRSSTVKGLRPSVHVC